jgi:hypothetical protein
MQNPGMIFFLVGGNCFSVGMVGMKSWDCHSNCEQQASLCHDRRGCSPYGTYCMGNMENMGVMRLVGDMGLMAHLGHTCMWFMVPCCCTLPFSPHVSKSRNAPTEQVVIVWQSILYMKWSRPE